jgi:sarcosine oxidase
VNTQRQSENYDAIVVGVGGMGSAACYQLAKRGMRVLGLERFDIPHDKGSSHGATRIIRLAYYEHPAYVMLLKRAYELWDEIERRAGEILLVKTGSLDISRENEFVFQGSLASCIEFGLDHEVLPGRSINQRFPGYQLPDDLMGLFQPDGGFLLPERAIVAFVNAAMESGAVIQAREKVLDWELVGDHLKIKTDKGVYEADRLIFTGGAWMGQLLPLLEILAIPERQVLAWLQPLQHRVFTPDRFPVFNMMVDEGRFYGFPVYSIPGFKFGKYHHLDESGEVDVLDLEPTWEDEVLLRDFADRYFPQAAGPTMSLKGCLFTNSPDEHFIIDRHPDTEQVCFAAGFSGHGFKFASMIGEVMADLAEKGETRHDISLFRLDRFSK